MGFSLKGLGKALGAALAIAAVAWTGQYYLVSGFSTAFSTYMATAAVLSAASFAATSLLAEKPNAGDFTNGLRGQLVNTKLPSEAARVVYGKTRLGGNVVFLETTGSTNQTLFQVATIAGHEITAFDQIFINEDYFGGTYKGSSSAFEYATLLGTDTQSASSLLSTTSAAAYQYKGIACLICKLVYNQDIYTQGIPNITAVVRGKKVYDPRTSTTAYSNNAALVIRDYLTDTIYGMGATSAEIDDTAFIAAANICDQDVTLADESTEKRYTINGAFSSAEQPKDVLKKMLTACGGVLTYTGGKWTLKVAAWRSPTTTITVDDIVGEITMQASQSKRDIFNAIKGVYSSPLDMYQPVSFPPITNSTYESEDGEQIWKDVEYPFTTSYATCQRLAKIELEKARQQITVNLSCNLKAFAIQPADNIYLTFERYGWSSKVFEVINWEFSTKEDAGSPVPVINLVLKETAESAYDWNNGEETTVDPSPDTNLPNAFSVNAPSGLTATAQAVVVQDGNIQSGIALTWTAPSSSFITQYEVQWIRGSGNQDLGLVSANADTNLDYQSITSLATLALDYGSVSDSVPSAETNYNSAFTTVTNFTIVPVIPNTEYTIRVRAYNSIGVRSPWTSLTSTPQGDTTPAGNVYDVTVLSGYKQLTLTWNNPSDADFDYVEIFRNTVDNLLTSTRAGVIRASIFVDSNLGINQTLYYWLRTVDKSGNRSDWTSTYSGTTSFVDSDIFSQEVMNLFSEAGAYGIEPVATLPAVGDFNGQIKYDTTANKLYRWNAATSSWTDDIFSITAGSVDLASFASGLEPISVVSSLPSPSGYTGAKIVYLTTDGKLYRYSGGAWTTALSASDISGTLASGNFSNDLRPVEVVATLPSTGNFTGRTAVLTTDGKLYRYTSTGWSAAVPTTDLSGTISAGQIASSAITTDKLAANAVTTGKIEAGAITTDLLAANNVTTGKIAAGAITTDLLAANAITADKIQAGAIQTDKIAANAITGGLIAASGVITDTAQISNSVITNANIANGAITTAKINDLNVTTAKLANASITAAKIVDATITGAKIGTAEITTLKIAGQSVTIPVTSYVSGSTAVASVVLDGEYPILVIATFTQASGYSLLSISDQTGQIWTGQPEPATLATQSLTVTRSAGTWTFSASGGDGPTSISLIVCKR